MPEWDEGKIVNLIELYREREIIWNPKDKDYYKKHSKLDAWEEIGTAMGIPAEDCKRKMLNVWSSWRREMISSQTSGIILLITCLDIRNKYCKLVKESPVAKYLNVTANVFYRNSFSAVGIVFCNFWSKQINTVFKMCWTHSGKIFVMATNTLEL